MEQDAGHFLMGRPSLVPMLPVKDFRMALGHGNMVKRKKKKLSLSLATESLRHTNEEKLNGKTTFYSSTHIRDSTRIPKEKFDRVVGQYFLLAPSAFLYLLLLLDHLIDQRL